MFIPSRWRGGRQNIYRVFHPTSRPTSIDRSIVTKMPTDRDTSRADPVTERITAGMDDPYRVFPSRRSVVQSANGIVACSQPLAAQAGLKILRDGGNAAVPLPFFPFPSLPPPADDGEIGCSGSCRSGHKRHRNRK